MRRAGYLLIHIRDRLRAIGVDRRNKALFGDGAPRYGEGIEVPVAEITSRAMHGLKRRMSGKVVEGDWDRDTQPLDSDPKISACLDHWVEGKSWEETDIYQHIMDLIREKGRIDGCRSPAEVQQRYAALDAIFEDVNSTRQIRPASIERPFNFRECGGIFIHLGRNGDPIFGGGGHHRLAIAIAAKLPTIPAQLGVVHPGALSRLPSLRLNQATHGFQYVGAGGGT